MIHTSSANSSEMLIPVHPPQDQWAAMLAHELRSPLGAVLMALDELRPVCESEQNAREVRDMAERGSRQMARVIEDILDLSRGLHGKLSLGRELVDMPAAIAGAVAAVRPAMKHRRHQLTVDVPAQLPRVAAQDSRVEQVMTNLLTNAAKFTNPGGRIRLAVEPIAGFVRIAVRDSGIGIDPDLLPRIFEPFFQTLGPRDRSPGGLGLGLALVKSLVELHGGKVSAHSDGPGTGSEFVVCLPTSNPFVI